MDHAPFALERDTIFECVFETRFARGSPSSDELLPGIIFTALKHRFSGGNPLPLSQFPKALREHDPNLAYQPIHSLEGKNLRLMLGGRVATLSFTGPYPGWANVEPIILECSRAVLNTELVGSLERCSLKYVNLLTDGRDVRDLSQLNLRLELDGFSTAGGATAIVSEFGFEGLTTIVEIRTDMTIVPPPESGKAKGSGVMVNVDVIHNGPFGNFEQELPETLNRLHDAEKRIFFSLLEKSTLQRLGPIWSRQ